MLTKKHERWHMKATKGVAAAALLLLVSSGAFAASFPDTVGHWAEKEIDAAVEAGYVDGYPDGTFLPDDTVSRGEFIKLATAAVYPDELGDPLCNQDNGYWAPPSDESGFPGDVCGNWVDYQGWLDLAVTNKLVLFTDYSNGLWPNEKMPREEATALLIRSIGTDPKTANQDEINRFQDRSSISAQWQDFVALGVKLGLVTGYPDGSFRPTSSISRAEAVTMVERAMAIRRGEKPPVSGPIDDEYSLTSEHLRLRSPDTQTNLDSPMKLEGRAHFEGRTYLVVVEDANRNELGRTTIEKGQANTAWADFSVELEFKDPETDTGRIVIYGENEKDESMWTELIAPIRFERE